MTLADGRTTAREASDDQWRRVLLFSIATGLYGTGIDMVQEIIGAQPITRVPGASTSVRGVINLRGMVIPVVDLAHRLSLGTGDESTCVVIVRSGRVRCGLLVDQVSEVRRVRASDIGAPPTMEVGEHTEFLTGIAQIDDQICLLLDVERVLTHGLADAPTSRSPRTIVEA